MNNLPENQSHFSIIDLKGSGAKDFAQRMFTRDFRGLKPGQGKLSLFLDATAKVQSLFWVFVEENGLRLLVQAADKMALYDLIERYHFADPFVTEIGGSLWAQWTPFENSNGLGEKKGEIYQGVWRSTQFTFNPTSPKITNESNWEDHRSQNKIPAHSSDYSNILVFKTGLDELCDAGKGCYIGQEVLERVRTHAKK